MAKYLHHSIIKQAAKLEITMLDQGHGVYLATDNRTGVKTEGTDAKALLATVIAARPAEPKPEKPAKVAKAPKAPKAPKPAKAPKPTKAKKARKDADEGDDEGEGDAEESDEAELPASIVAPEYKARYAEHGGSNGDELAEVLAAFVKVDGDLDLGKLRIVAKDNGLELRGEVNNGQKRMILGNNLRALLRHGKDVKVGSHTIRGEKKAKAD